MICQMRRDAVQEQNILVECDAQFATSSVMQSILGVLRQNYITTQWLCISDCVFYNL